MEEKRISDLIDQYLLGNISPQDRAYLEELRASDPTVNLRMQESKSALAIILSARNRIIRERLREIDRKESSQAGRLIRTAIPFILILMFIISFLCWASQYYAQASIARRHFDTLPMPQTSLNETAALEKKWEQANLAFLHKDYGLALNLYESWNQDAGQEMAYATRWNILLTQFALHGTTPAWKQDLERFIRVAPPSLQIKAGRLQQFLESPFYRIFLASLQDHLSTIRPRLI